MSAASAAAAAQIIEGGAMMMSCACCGIAECDDNILKTCTACKSARYCSVECQKQHRSQHKGACKKRAAELRDELLFKQPESNHYGDCPICCLPLLLDEHKSLMMACCSKRICIGCDYANFLRQLEGNLQRKCPFCRHPAPKSQEQAKMNMMKRVAAIDPVALCQMGSIRFNDGDYNTAFEYWTKATGLGDVGAHLIYHCCIGKGSVLRRIRKSGCIIWKRLPLAGTT